MGGNWRRTESWTRSSCATELFAMIAEGKLKLRIEFTYKLADAQQAHRDLEARKTTGKLLPIP